MYKVSLSVDGVHMTSNAPYALVKVPCNIMNYGIFISGANVRELCFKHK